MSILLPACLLLAASSCALAKSSGQNLGPTYNLNPEPPIKIDNEKDQMDIYERFSNFSETEYYEWEGYDGWYNNLAHPEWGGAGESLRSLQLT